MLTFDELFEKKSPYKPETLQKYKKKWENGDKIPFGIEASLKAQGMIPRANGKIEVSDDYKKEGVKPKVDFVDKYIKPISDKPDTHRERVEKKIHKSEKEKLKKINHPEPIESHPDSSHKGNLKDEDLEGNIGKKKIDNAVKKQKVKSSKKRLKKYYNPKALEGKIPTFNEFINEADEIGCNEEFTIKGLVPTYEEFKNVNESLKDEYKK